MKRYSKKDITKVLDYFKYDYENHDTYYLMRTVCHHLSNGSKKLYVYFNDDDALFYCYTHCGAMSPVNFIMHSQHVTYHEAMNIMQVILGSQDKIENVDLLETPLSKIKKEKPAKKNAVYKPDILDRYYSYAFKPWIDEGISIETQNKFGIKFSVVDKKIIIPQKDAVGHIVGVRSRALDPEDIKKFGKYHPETVGGIVKPVNTSTILYGLYENKKYIRKTKQAIVFEAEKSVMQLDTFYYGKSNAVALYGSNMSVKQGELLRGLGVNELVVALDKEYQTKQQYELYVRRLIQKFTKMLPWFNVSLVLDDLQKPLLDYKDSPSDKGRDIFVKLMKERILIE